LISSRDDRGETDLDDDGGGDSDKSDRLISSKLFNKLLPFLGGLLLINRPNALNDPRLCLGDDIDFSNIGALGVRFGVSGAL
jgi:hypothetical protein